MQFGCLLLEGLSDGSYFLNFPIRSTDVFMTCCLAWSSCVLCWTPLITLCCNVFNKFTSVYELWCINQCFVRITFLLARNIHLITGILCFIGTMDIVKSAYILKFVLGRTEMLVYGVSDRHTNESSAWTVCGHISTKEPHSFTHTCSKLLSLQLVLLMFFIWRS
jgi:hypothetical protein